MAKDKKSVFIVVFCDDHVEIDKVFSTRKKAEKYISEAVGIFSRSSRAEAKEAFSIQEREVL